MCYSLPARVGCHVVLIAAWLAISTFVSAAPIAPLTLIDFENAAEFKLIPNRSRAKLVAAGEGQGLAITTDAGASYPSVSVEPKSGPWDLSKYTAVTMDVRNPQSVPVRVLLSVNGPGADGRHNCSVSSVTVSQGKSTTLTARLGVWHGDPSPIDLTKIVSATILLDRPKQSHEFIVDNLRAIGDDTTSLAELAGEPFFSQLKPVLGRGINLGNALDAPNEGEWGVTLQEEYFEAIQKAGFDNIRLPVRWSTHADSSAPFLIDRKFLARVDWAVEQTLSRKMSLVLNIHHYEEIMNRPDDHKRRFLGLWEQLASHYQDQPNTLVFELLNEPNSQLTADKWNDLVAAGIQVIRRTNPNRPIMVGPVSWNSIGELKSLELPESDRNLIATFHYYSPFKFTHQGASFVGPQAQEWLGTKWSDTAAERQAVARDFDIALAWAVKHRRPIYLGEFGAYMKADMNSRALWTKCVAEEAWKRKIGYAYWEFCSGFGAYAPTEQHWHDDLLRALIPSAK